MTVWRQLCDELDRWADLGRVATLWWRDDDAARATHSLGRLLGVRSRAGVPLALALIPATVEEEAADRIGGDSDAGSGIDVLQHGYAHHNHAPPGQKKSEFDDGRPVDAALDELGVGARRLESMFGPRFAPVLVPPWNRIADRLVARLNGAGFTGISTFGPRRRAGPVPGLTQVNTHVDIIDWRGTRGFAGADVALASAIGHLRARRTGGMDDAEPTGLLSHHLVHDEAAWRFIDNYVEATTSHPAARWVRARDAFAGGRQQDRGPWTATAIR